LAGIDLDVRPGQAVALVGANGSGKTTLLRLVAGLVRPAAGSASVCGFPAGSLEARRSVAYVPDEPAGLDELTVAEQVTLLTRLYGTEDGPGERALETLGLRAVRDVPVGALSRGLRRRAALAAALAADPDVLVVDEATVTLDAEALAALESVLRARVMRGVTTLLATHDLDFVARACDRAVVLRGGAQVAAGPAAVAAALTALVGPSAKDGTHERGSTSATARAGHGV
jgi:ABC-type multidrug transport system ATPase subunit